MQALKHYGRRRLDRQIAVGAIVAVLAGLFVYQVACGGKNTVGPSDVPAYTPPTPTGSVGTPQTITPGTAIGDDPTGGGPGPVSVVCNGSSCTFSNSGKSKHAVFGFCTIPQETVATYGSLKNIWIPIGENTRTIDHLELCHKLCGEHPVQIDWFAGEGEHIGHDGGRVARECEEECKPGDWVEVDRSEPYQGDTTECPISAQNSEEGCHECFEWLVDILYSDGCDKREEKGVVVDVGSRETECQAPELCYYEVDCSLGGGGFTQSTGRACQALKENRCEWNPPLGAGGDWGNWFGQGEGHEQCRVAFPGYSNSHFQLIPGQSAEGCLNKHDD